MLTLYIIIGILSVLLFISLFINYRLYSKVVFFEEWFENFADVVENIYEHMQIMDERGVMDQDDAFGRFFDAMREMMLDLFSMGFYDAEDLEGVEVEE